MKVLPLAAKPSTGNDLQTVILVGNQLDAHFLL